MWTLTSVIIIHSCNNCDNQISGLINICELAPRCSNRSTNIRILRSERMKAIVVAIDAEGNYVWVEKLNFFSSFIGSRSVNLTNSCIQTLECSWSEFRVFLGLSVFLPRTFSLK